MPLDQTAVEPAVAPGAPVAPVAAPDAPQSPAPTDAGTNSGGISQDLLQIPAIAGLLAGKPAAISAKIKDFDKTPDAKLISENKDALQKAGMGFYRSRSGTVGVIFNQMALHPEALKQADKAGKLLEIAPPIDIVNQQIGASATPPGAPLAGGPAAPPPVTPPQSLTAPQSQAAARDVQAKRLLNITPQAATKGPVPGQGNLLKSILKPVL